MRIVGVECDDLTRDILDNALFEMVRLPGKFNLRELLPDDPHAMNIAKWCWRLREKLLGNASEDDGTGAWFDDLLFQTLMNLSTSNTRRGHELRKPYMPSHFPNAHTFNHEKWEYMD